MAGTGRRAEERDVSGDAERLLSRRAFLGHGVSAAALAALSQMPLALAPKGCSAGPRHSISM